MSIDEEKLIVWIEQVTKKLAHLEANQMAIINGDFCDTNTEPQEPLIKDERIRKAVRAWADANNITQVSYDAGWNAFRCTDFVIAFDYDFDRHDGLEDMKSYTITELCGEVKSGHPLVVKSRN